MSSTTGSPTLAPTPSLSLPAFLPTRTCTVDSAVSHVLQRQTRWERLKSAKPYLRLQKRRFEICVGRVHEKLLISDLRLLLTKTQCSSDITITVQGKLFCCLSWNPGHENWEKSWNPGQNFPLMLSVSWIPRQCLSWIPRQYCCYNDAFAAALWLVRWFWVIIIGKAKELKLNQFYINGNCFDWHEKSQSTNRDTQDWYQNCSMSSNNGRLWWCGSLFKTGTKLWKIRIFV